MADIYIHAAAALGPQQDYTAAARAPLRADPAPTDLKALSKTLLGQHLRQASHFVELAALGATLCLNRLAQPAPSDTAVYLGTGLAENRKNDALFEQVLPPGPGLASPFDFINAANNMAAFYVARLAGIEARNLTVMQDELSFEYALTLACSDLQHGAVNHALVGGVDEMSLTRAQHLRRLRLDDAQIMGEGSGWLYLSTDPFGARGELLGVTRVPPAADASADILNRIHEWRRAPEPVILLPGFRLAATEVEQLTAAWPELRVENYLDFCGSFPTAAAFGLAARFDAPCPQPALYLHLNRDADGRGMLVGVRILA